MYPGRIKFTKYLLLYYWYIGVILINWYLIKLFKTKNKEKKKKKIIRIMKLNLKRKNEDNTTLFKILFFVFVICFMLIDVSIITLLSRYWKNSITRYEYFNILILFFWYFPSCALETRQQNRAFNYWLIKWL